MNRRFSLTQFLYLFPTEDACLEEFKKLRFPNGIKCEICRRTVKHYKIKGRTAYSCKVCRNQVFPLSGTILEKTSTPLRTWFYAMFLMTHSRANISIVDLQREIGVTYKTAWRMYKSLRVIMAQNKGELLTGPRSNVHIWTIFSKLEITVTQKQEATI